MEGEISLVWKDRPVLSKDSAGFQISKAGGSHIPSATLRCSLAEKPGKVGFYPIHGAGHAVGFPTSYEKQVPVRLRSPFRHCWVLHSDQKHFWLPSSYPIRQCSAHSSVFSSQFSGPARPHLGLCSEPCSPACLSSIHSLSPSLLSQIQSVLDRHVLFPLLTINDLLFQPDQQICFSHPHCQSASFSFLHSLSCFLVHIASPGPPGPHCFFSSLSSFAGFPAVLQTACPYRVTSCPLHFNQLSPSYWHHSQVDRE